MLCDFCNINNELTQFKYDWEKSKQRFSAQKLPIMKIRQRFAKQTDNCEVQDMNRSGCANKKRELASTLRCEVLFCLSLHMSIVHFSK